MAGQMIDCAARIAALVNQDTKIAAGRPYKNVDNDELDYV